MVLIGTYPSKPKDVPGIGYVAGNECVAQVVQVGSNVRDVSVGDWVIPGKAGVFGMVYFISIHFGNSCKIY